MLQNLRNQRFGVLSTGNSSGCVLPFAMLSCHRIGSSHYALMLRQMQESIVHTQIYDKTDKAAKDNGDFAHVWSGRDLNESVLYVLENLEEITVYSGIYARHDRGKLAKAVEGFLNLNSQAVDLNVYSVLYNPYRLFI